MDDKSHVPLFVSFITLFLGCYDILRGVMHTLNLEYSALHIAKTLTYQPLQLLIYCAF